MSCRYLQQLNKDAFEIIYHQALTASCELAMKEGPYELVGGLPLLNVLFTLWFMTTSLVCDREIFASMEILK